VTVLEGLQGNVVTGYGTTRALYLFARVGDTEAARHWLASAGPRITTYKGWSQHRSRTTLNAAFTYDGLVKLGVPQLRIEHLKAFREGMSARRQLLGDPLKGERDTWEEGLRDNHMLLVLTARKRSALTRAQESLRDEIAAHDAFTIVAECDAQRLDHGAEHFGFKDGFSQPSIARVAGSGPRRGEGTLTRWGHWRRLALGEFVLGYRDEGGLFAPAPLGPLGDDATFMVVRKLEQKVAAFRDYIEQTAARVNLDEALLRAKMVGRWDNGSALARYPRKPGPPAGKDPKASRFHYAIDPKGLRCPVGAHVRRANPRDSLGWQGRLTQRHRIIRRGMPYGPELAAAAGSEDDGERRGLMFVCHQADIERQFEFIQRQWLADGDALRLGSASDPLVATGGRRQMVIAGHPPAVLEGIPAFVQTLGGAYYLLPGAAGLQAISAGAC
jgi:Dyp-type peroxidase family